MRPVSRNLSALLGTALVAGALAAVPAGAAPTWTSPIVTLETDVAVDVKVALDAAGNATAAWVQEGDTEVSVEASTHPVGGTWSAPVDIAVPGDIFNSVSVAAAAGVSVAAWSQTVGGHNVIHAATWSAGGGWSAPVPLSAADHDAIRPRVGLDAAGGGVVSWLDGANTLSYVTRSAAGVWSAPVDVPAGSSPGNTGDDYDLAVDDTGHAVLAWEHYDFGLSRRVIQAAFRPAGGSFGDPVTVSSATVDTYRPDVAVNADGVATVVWREQVPGTTQVKAATRSAGGSWSPVQDVSASAGFNVHPVVVVDAAGVSTAVWTREESLQPGKIQYSRRPAGGTWSAPLDLDTPADGFEIRPSPSTRVAGSRRRTSSTPTVATAWRPRSSGRERRGHRRSPCPRSRPARTRRRRMSPWTTPARPWSRGSVTA